MTKQYVPDLVSYHDQDYNIPTYYGKEAYKKLVRRYGLPNAAPKKGESLFGKCRVLFVDDDNNGRPVAYWTYKNPPLLGYIKKIITNT